MANCQMKKGFFYLRECEKQAVETCRVCGREFCSEHMRIMPGKNEPACLDCIGKAMQKKTAARNTADDDDDYYYDSVWCYGYRHNYYRNNRYSPWYDGDDFSDDYYSELDVRSFNDKSDEGNELQAEEFDDSAGVFDS